jgi:hypothetical protein
MCTTEKIIGLSAGTTGKYYRAELISGNHWKATRININAIQTGHNDGMKISTYLKKVCMKVVLIFSALLMTSIIHAQDTTKNRPMAVDTPKINSAPAVRPEPTSPARESDEYTNKDKVAIEVDQLPMAVQQALRDPMYAGLDHSSLFQDRITGEYIVEIKNGAATKTYRFNEKGKLVEDPNKPKKKQ